MFEEGFEAMRELLDAELGEPAAPQALELAAGDRAALLADWLAELAFLAEAERFVPERLASLELAGAALRARVEGRRGDPPHLVKAATYHRLSFERAGDGWRATVVLDHRGEHDGDQRRAGRGGKKQGRRAGQTSAQRQSLPRSPMSCHSALHAAYRVYLRWTYPLSTRRWPNDRRVPAWPCLAC